MKIVSLNLRHGGLKRVKRIGDYLLRNGADVIVLTEFRDNAPGAILTEQLTAAGFHGFVAPAHDARKNRVAIFGPTSA